MTNSDEPKDSGAGSGTSLDDRRQTLAKLVLGHLVRMQPAPHVLSPDILVFLDDDGTTFLDKCELFPSEDLMARLALAIPSEQWQSCRIHDLTDDFVAALLEVDVDGRRYDPVTGRSK